MGLEIINTIRKERGMTVEQLSEASGVPLNTLKKICAGIATNPTLNTIKAIAAALGCTLDDFLDDSERPRITSAAAHFDPDTLTDEGREMYNNLIDMLANKYAKN